MTDQSGPGAHFLYRDITVSASEPVLKFSIFVGNRAGAFSTPNSLTLPNFNVGGPPVNQQARVDIMSPSANIQDVSVLLNLFQTQVGSPLVSGYTEFTTDLSAFIGQTVRLRFSEVDNSNFFQLGVDDVQLVGSTPPGFGVGTADFTASLLGPSLSLLAQSALFPGAVVSLTDGETLNTDLGLLHLTSMLVSADQLVSIGEGATLVSPTAIPVAQLTDSSVALTGSAFDLRGSATRIETDPDGAGLEVGTEAPIQAGGALLEANGATALRAANGLGLDTALFEATAPLFVFNPGSSFTSASHLITLAQKAKLTANLPGDALVKLNGAIGTISNGALLNAAGGSFARITGNLLTLANGSTLTLGNGPLVMVSGNSSFVLTGSLVNFVGSGNSLNVSNALAPTGFLNGVPVFSALGGTNGFTVTNTAPFTNLNTNGNVIKINGAVLPSNATSGSATGSLLAITSGAASKIKLQ